MRAPTALPPCPACNAGIDPWKPYSWCSECGEPLPAHLQEQLPALRETRRAAAPPPEPAAPPNLPVPTDRALEERWITWPSWEWERELLLIVAPGVLLFGVLSALSEQAAVGLLVFSPLAFWVVRAGLDRARQVRYGSRLLRLRLPVRRADTIEAVLIIERARPLDALYVELREPYAERVAAVAVPVPRLPRQSRTRLEVPLKLSLPPSSHATRPAAPTLVGYWLIVRGAASGLELDLRARFPVIVLDGPSPRAGEAVTR